MNTYQLYTKSGVSIALDVNATSFLDEKYQLVEQGFERKGDMVKATDKQQALTLGKNVQLNALSNFSGVYLLLLVIGGLTGLRFLF